MAFLGVLRVQAQMEQGSNRSVLNSVEVEASKGMDADVESLLNEFKDVFSDELPKRLPPCRKVDHRIDVEEPLHKAPYRLGKDELVELQRHLKDYLEKGIYTTECVSIWSTGVVRP